MLFNESSKVVMLYTVLGVHENAMKNFLPKHNILRWLDRVFWLREIWSPTWHEP